MSICQLSIFVENQPKKLATVTEVLAANDVNIRALSIADTADYGILRLIVSDSKKAYDALKANGIMVAITEVIAIKIPDVPGGLNSAIQVLSQKDIAIEYIYAFVSNSTDDAFVVVRVSNNENALKALEEAGIKTATDENFA